MSTVETGLDKSTDPGSVSFSERLDSVFSLVTTALGEVEASEETVRAIEEEVDPLIEEAEQLEQDESEEPEKDGDIQDLRRENQELRKELSDYREENEKDKASMKGRISSVEAGSSDATDANPGENTLHRPNSPLEQVVTTPEPMVETELSANVERARFIAKDIRSYTTKVPAGFAINSTEIRRVISAKEESRTHTQTVTRIMEALTDLGKDDVKLIDGRGKRKVVFSEDLVQRLDRLNESHAVVAGKV